MSRFRILFWRLRSLQVASAPKAPQALPEPISDTVQGSGVGDFQWTEREQNCEFPTDVPGFLMIFARGGWIWQQFHGEIHGCNEAG